MAKNKNELSVIVQLCEGTNLGLKSDLSKLNDYQSHKLKEFFVSILREPTEPDNRIKEINSYPYIIREIPKEYEVGNYMRF